jgi:murein DD-endopeptidase MepM/ murein hydrolase activator NlpD
MSRTAAGNVSSAAMLRAANPQVCDLAVGESCFVATAGGKAKHVKLLGLREYREPYYESASGKFIEAVVRADVEVAVDGFRAVVVGGPFRLPQAVNGVSVLVTTTRSWLDGVDPDVLAKDVRLELRDASLPFYEPRRFAFPIRNYLWHSSNYQHTWLALAVNQRRHYYHRGEDMGMIPDLDEVVSMTGGRVKAVPGPEGDHGSNDLYVEDDSGLRFCYAHMNASHIRQDLQPGVAVRRGEELGLTGNTWRGKPMRDPHLHVGVTSGGTLRNTFPIIADAYLASFLGAVMPIAGGCRHLWAGGSIDLDGSLSIASPGRRIVSYEWTFTDGTRARSATARRTYPRIGAYSEQLRVADNQGASDLDFVQAFVLDRSNKKMPPYIWMNYYPIRGIRPGTVIQFWTDYAHTKDVLLDFGDRTQVSWARTLYHAYRKPGTYIVTATGADSGSGPGVFKVRVVVD